MGRRAILPTVVGLTALAGCADLPVDARPVGRVELSVTSLKLALGDTAVLVATVFDESGEPLDGRQLNWSSTEPEIAIVSDSGVVRSVGAGDAKIVAEGAGRWAEAEVTVRVSFTAVDAGARHTCAVTDRGRVACWGWNRWGQLGDHTLFSSSRPALVRTDPAFVSLTSGAAHTCALDADGATACWGANWSGQLGIGVADAAPHALPTLLEGAPAFTALTAGDRHVCALSTTGDSYCWGGGARGQLGSASPSDRCRTFQDEPCSLEPEPVERAPTFRLIDAGAEHACGLTADGGAHCWGRNTEGQLGDSSTTSRATPVAVVGGLVFSTISAGVFHTCGVTHDREAYCWGDNLAGRLGDGTTTTASAPVRVAGVSSLAAVTPGDVHTCALTTDGRAYCWGANGGGQLGIGSTAGQSATPLPVIGMLRFTAISAGDFHTCGIATDGTLYCWGANSFGQLGIAAGGDRGEPTRVVGQP